MLTPSGRKQVRPNKDEYEESVDGDDPEDVLEEDERTVETEQPFPRQLLVRTHSGAPVHRHRIPTVVLLNDGEGVRAR